MGVQGAVGMHSSTCACPLSEHERAGGGGGFSKGCAYPVSVGCRMGMQSPRAGHGGQNTPRYIYMEAKGNHACGRLTTDGDFRMEGGNMRCKTGKRVTGLQNRGERGGYNPMMRVS